MSINFDEIIDRRGTSCSKWDFAVERGYPADVLPLWIADMDFKSPPAIVAELIKRSEHGILGYTEVKDSYKDCIINWLQKRHGYSPRKDSLVITAGIVSAIAMAIQSYTKEGEGVLIQEPVYYPFGETVRVNNRRVVSSPLVLNNGHYEIDFCDFERKIIEGEVKLFLLCSPHNPVGRVWAGKELEQMANICLSHGVIILADEIHSDFIRKGHKHTVFASLSTAIERQTVLCTSPSKSFNIAGLQISNIFIADDKLRSMFVKTMTCAGYGHTNPLGLVAVEAAYTKGEDWLAELIVYIEENYQRTKDFIAREMPKVKLIEPEGTYLIWLDFREYGMSAEELDRFIIDKAGLWLDSGDIFGDSGSGFQRINIATPWSFLEQALNRLAVALKNL